MTFSPHPFDRLIADRIVDGRKHIGQYAPIRIQLTKQIPDPAQMARFSCDLAEAYDIFGVWNQSNDGPG